MTADVTGDDVGKAVIDANGDRIGTIAAVRDGMAMVEVETDVGATVTMALGWSEETGGYPLRPQSIERITESTVHLRSNL